MPVTFVIVAAPTLADVAKVLDGKGAGLGIETVTAGWPAGFLTGIARPHLERLDLAGASGAADTLQSPMLGGDPADWARWMPGYGGMRVLIDGGLTAGFDEGPILAVALAWIVMLSCAVVVLLRRTIKG